MLRGMGLAQPQAPGLLPVYGSSASTARGWVGLGALQMRVLCFVSTRKYNTIVFM